MALHKDEVLNSLAATANVAQFVSFRPNKNGTLAQSYSRVSGFDANHHFATAREAVSALLANSSDNMVNIRSYEPNSPRSKEFVYGLKDADEVLETLNRLFSPDMHFIVNETIDIHDGGVSGVVQGQVIEFSPDDTPRCVEKPGVASLPMPVATQILKTIYGFSPELNFPDQARAEFSIHPKPRGYNKKHTILWEYETTDASFLPAAFSWPNNFSRYIGDKAYGLIVAHALGMPVPRTTVIGRQVAPFSFGQDTGTFEVWTRTCPAEPQPGLYTTVKGWRDPFRLLADEDPEDLNIRSVLCQAAVRAKFSGAALAGPKGKTIVEGRRGEGDKFMLGLETPETLPSFVRNAVQATYATLSSRLGPVRFEWVHDGNIVWVVQLHCGATSTDAEVIVPGEASEWVEFHVVDGLEKLRELLRQVPEGAGVVVVGNVGLTSHVADLLRKSKHPARLRASDM